MLVDLYAFHHVQLPLLLVFENLLLPCDFGEHNVLFKLLLEDLVRVPIALDGFDRLELILRLNVLDLIVLPLLLSPLLLQQQRGQSVLPLLPRRCLLGFLPCLLLSPRPPFTLLLLLLQPLFPALLVFAPLGALLILGPLAAPQLLLETFVSLRMLPVLYSVRSLPAVIGNRRQDSRQLYVVLQLVSSGRYLALRSLELVGEGLVARAAARQTAVCGKLSSLIDLLQLLLDGLS